MKYLSAVLAIGLLFLLNACDPLEDECDFKLCANGAVCVDGTCQCKPGFSGPDCTESACANVNCINGGTCINGKCDCPEGFTGNSCETEIDPCSSTTCQNGGTCVDGTCDCLEGFTGSNCEMMVDPCNEVNCENGGECVNGLCNCPEGFTGTNCEEIDPCMDITCENEGSCENGTCNCLPTYAGEFCEIYTPNLFQGFWSASDNCDSQMIEYVTSLSVNQNNDAIFTVGEFGEFGSSRKFDAQINGFQIIIERIEVENDLFLEAFGTISSNGEQIEWTYTIERAGETDNCSGIWKKV